MNYLQLLARRLDQAFAVLRDPDAGLLLPLPEPVVNPRVDAEQLGRAAHEQGRTDGQRYLYDGWSFGRTGEPPDAVLDPEYVRGLRHQCESAIHEHRDRQRLTDARLSDLHLVTREAERDMATARERMARVAVRAQLDEEDSLRAFLRRRSINADALELPPLSNPVWEGEVPPMRLIWRVLLVGFLTTVVFGIEHHAATAYLPAPGVGPAAGFVLTAAVAGLTVLGPLLAGQLFRHRHATGSDRVLAALTFVLLLPSLAIVSGVGLLAARLSALPSTTSGLTPATLIVVFDVVLFLACAMAYLLGLAQRHPFQQAFARSRQLRNQTIQLTQRMGTRINPDYRATPDGEPTRPAPAEPAAETAETEPTTAAPADRELAIRHAYRAAEDSYYQGLIEAVADPTFTEAVLRRRNRPVDPPDGDAP